MTLLENEKCLILCSKAEAFFFGKKKAKALRKPKLCTTLALL